MGKWSQYRTRGGGGLPAVAAVIPAPSDTDWTFTQDGFGGDLFAEVDTGAPPGYNSFGIQTQVDGSGYTFAASGVLGTAIDLGPYPAGHSVDAQAQYLDSSMVNPPGPWSDPKNIIPT